MKCQSLNRLSGLLVAAVLMVGMVWPHQVFAVWSSPTTLQTFTFLGLPTGKASVSVNASGDGVAVWLDEGSGKLMYALQKKGVWKAGRVLYSPAISKNETLESPQATLLADGTIAVVFSSTTPGPLKYCAVGLRVVRCYGPSKSFAKLAVLAPSATAWTKQNLSQEGVAVNNTQIGADKYGNITASWTYLEKAGLPSAIQVATKGVGQASWSVPLTLHQSGGLSVAPILSVGSNGQAMLAWQETLLSPTGNAYAINAVYADNATTGVWTSVGNVKTVSAPIPLLRTAVDGVGKTYLVWNENYGVTLVSGFCSSGCSWQEQAVFTAPVDNSVTAYAPDIAVDDQGDFFVAWGKSSAAGNAVVAELHQIDGNVVAAEWNGNGVPDVDLGADASLAVVTWVDNNDYSAYAAKFVPVAGSPGQWVSQAKRNLGNALWDSQIVVAAAATSHASAVWLTGAGREFIYSYMGSVLH